ncbi:MAG TPA: 2-dehydro-3-deoxy-D-gluconate 5-dehydrogenase KduD, partial [Candidatus Solibacter sp.]|nr:2-dehydro-3-deoxy-D-gluconate 5-dehydrogenase KduD [Candidatus Solibacter sp.]
MDLFNLSGKTALVTGSSAGIGAAIAVAIAEAGADVICHGNSRPAEETCRKIEGLGRRAMAVQADLSQPEGAQELFQKTRSFAAIDILVNNAGIIRRAPAHQFALGDWDMVLQVNLRSVFQLSQLVGREWIEKQKPGKILNIASLLAFQGGITVPAYAASKGAVAQLTKALANEWAPRRINVNAIAPGYIRTTNTAALQSDETRNRQILERIPAGRWGEAEDIGGGAVFLCSAASDYVHGHVLVVDGGWMGR